MSDQLTSLAKLLEASLNHSQNKQGMDAKERGRKD